MEKHQPLEKTTKTRPIYILFHKRNSFHLHKISLTMEELDSEVIAKIRRLDPGDAAKCFGTLRPICRTLSMQRVVIGTVNLVKPLDLETQEPRYQYIKQITRDDFLTTALHNPSVLSPTSSIIAKYLSDETFCGNLGAGPPAWSLYLEIDRRIASMWLFVALILSILGALQQA
ncbi:hypothetical protein V2W45_777994 [Cenococcum geophilum]